MLRLLASGYRAILWVRKIVRFVFASFQVLFSHIFTAKHLMHIVVVTLAFLVTATNIYAGDASSFGTDEESVSTSILTGLIGSANEYQPDEEVREESVAARDTSYLAGRAFSATEAYEESSDPAEDILYEEFADEEIPSPMANAVRVTPEFDAQQPHTRTKIEEYVVETGDTVASIAHRFDVSITTILAANKMTARDYIRPGQKLRILPVDGLVYTVKKGDTLAKIASVYKTDVQKILEFNGYDEATGIPIGLEILLPGGVLPPPPPTPKKPSQLAGNIKNVFVPPAAADRVGSSKMLWPTAARRITQYYKGSRHTGVDIAGPVGTAIYASEDGTVTFSGWNRGGYGNMIIVDHGNGYFTRYAHASKNLVGVGDAVKRGDVIALMGSTGRSTGPHLHFEVMIGSASKRVNPFDYVK